jgi:hypothetical protein|tara:strand:- start:129 stop:620 length:492 start_codon:yes stop_codon:yes gene_type:complete
MTNTSTHRPRRAAPRGARLALCLAFVVAMAAARPAEAFKWKWWKAKAVASYDGDMDMKDTSMKGGHHMNMKHMMHSSGGKWSGKDKWSGDDSECDDCGTWWKAKQWDKDSWWGKHTKRQDRGTWVPGTGLRAAKCLLHQCGWELKKCRFDTTCRESIQCAVGA